MKVLIISHLPVATQNNMGITFLSLFSRFEKQELCQLYIYPAYPDVDRCGSFYRVTDKEVLSSLVTFRRPGGKVAPELIHDRQGLYEVAEDESFYRDRKNKSAVRRLLRDAMWRMSRWYSRDLKAWLEEEKPDCIFVAPGVAKLLYDMALKISKKQGIPLITYICDEYYFVRKPKEPLDALRLKLLQGKIRRLVRESRHLVVICEELKQAYASFGTPTTVLMTGASARAEAVEGARQDICYFGNIRCNRYLSLAQVGKALEAVNRKLGTHHRLKIYTSEKDPEILGTFRDCEAIELRGFVTGDAFRDAFRQAGFLLHVEAFDEASIDYVRHSVSTKIADSLGSGIPLIAYGPDCVSSMKHLIRNRCAFTATDPGELEAMLVRALTHREAGEKILKNALHTARTQHSTEENGAALRTITEDILRGK